MMDVPKNFKVSIFGEVYSLMSNESDQHLLEASRRVDHMMKEIAEMTGIQDAKRLAVLVALRLASSMLFAEVAAQKHVQYYQKIAHKIDKTLAS